MAAAGGTSETIGGLVREFFIDFLGSLLPGLWFTLLAAPLTVLSMLLLWEGLTQVSQPSKFDVLFAFAKDFRIELVLAFLVFSYVFGGVFFRQDPKEPDQESASYILRKMHKTELARSVIQPGEEEYNSLPADGRPTRQQAYKWAHGEGGQFPYSHLKKYLTERGLAHLAKLVPWDWTESSQHSLRTKMFINVLKVRLQQLAPDKCAEIVRNEAHIRMMSSLWYAASGLRKLAFLSLVPSFLVAGEMLWWKNHDLFLAEVCGVLVLAAISYLFAAWLQGRIRRFFHYQRVREIVYVLETAYFVAEHGHPELGTNLQEPPSPHGHTRGASTAQ